MSAFEIFQQLCQIPHKSYHTQEMFAFLSGFCQRYGYEVKIDEAKNIYASKTNKPKLCLQSHYDMVGVGEADLLKPLEIYIDGQYVRAKNSSLGADNGAAIAVILELIEANADIEVLFTNNEEVGLDGANALSLPIRSNFLLNLDSEFFGEIIVGCAGGFDSVIEFAQAQAEIVKTQEKITKKTTKNAKAQNQKEIQTEFQTEEFQWICEVSAFGFVGGHSGVDIHKNIPSSIVAFALLIEQTESEILSICAGEKSNSIPVSLQATLGLKQDFAQHKHSFIAALQKGLTQSDKNDINNIYLQNKNKNLICDYDERYDSLRVHINADSGFVLKFINNPKSTTYYDKDTFVKFIHTLKHGVHVWQDHQILSSLNIAMIQEDNKNLKITLKARANTQDLLTQIKEHIQHAIHTACSPKTTFTFSHLYMPWQRDLDTDHPILQKIIRAFGWRHTEITQIHAGLECGILQGRFASMGLRGIVMASIGPTILYPHSLNECMDLGSFEEFRQVLGNLIRSL
ncbi:M28 family peptidase [Helicobacter fennelliae]|uniref:Aminoacyl-histidine dipeptidase n=1 Tax=Helicobacter fennelliae MRY12-0050 TaxID=1325130 RepID=T1D0L7_9HELI|nr:M28 family peptidase [Helicobacter fennelliae]GAD18761.1 aminoacyl-histidine dipeptidase [Helicobacter fennelliae MRY12-0050]STP07076.1 aminoacyl-histidine dipeptidase [Helicobacter fennelliae]